MALAASSDASARGAFGLLGVGRGAGVDLVHAARARLGLGVLGDALAEALGEARERLRELRRDDEDLVRLALAQLGQHLQVLVGEQRLVGLARVDRAEDGLDRLRLALGPAGSPRCAAPSARRTADCFSPSAVRICDCLTPSAVRIVARRSRSARICFSIASWMVRGGSTDFSSTRLTRMPQRPVASSSTTRSCVVDVVAAGQRLLERHAADHVAQRRDGQLLDRLQRVGDLVGRGLRVGDREVEDGVDPDDEVVLGDHRLRRERDDLLAQVDQRLHAVDERHDQRQPGLERALVAAEPLDDRRPAPGARSAPPAAATMNTNRARTISAMRPAVMRILPYWLTSAVAPRISSTCDARARLDDFVVVIGRAVQISPSSFTQPTPSAFAIRSTTIAVCPTSAAVPVLIRPRRALVLRGRSAARGQQDHRDDEEGRPLDRSPRRPRPTASPRPPPRPRTGARNRLIEAISPTAKITAAISQITQGSIRRIRSYPRAVTRSAALGRSRRHRTAAGPRAARRCRSA